jgi:hypothetical protein
MVIPIINTPQIKGRLFAAKMVAEIAPSLHPMTWYELMPGVVFGTPLSPW